MSLVEGTEMVGAGAWDTRRVCELASSAGRREKGGSHWCLQLHKGVQRRRSQALVMSRDGMRGNRGRVEQGKFWLNVRSVLARRSGAALEQDPERWRDLCP